jgi:GH25 family lysozyme M1 (1,4-beta-N-acetylmuramidase)
MAISGVDVSLWQGVIDWKQVKAAGVDFVMVRLGGRGYGEEGSLYADDRALEYIQGAQAAGIKAGGYFFSQAITTEEAVEEAAYVKNLLGDIKLEYPVAFDWEIIKDDNARTDKVTSTQATECAVAFCEKVKSFGYIPMIYSASREFYFKYDLSRLKDYELWLVQYADKPDFYYKFSMWQYSESGHIDGIDGSVDLNISFKSTADYAK